MPTELEKFQAQEIERLKKENADLVAKNQKIENPDFVKYMGLLWKLGEPRPYCPSCEAHPVMRSFPPDIDENWVCPANHVFDGTIKPPKS